MRKSVLRVLGGVRAQQHADHIISVALGRTLPHDTIGKCARIVQIRAESAVLARREVSHKAEQEFRDVSPGRLEDEVERAGIERRVDAGSGSCGRGIFRLLTERPPNCRKLERDSQQVRVQF